MLESLVALNALTKTFRLFLQFIYLDYCPTDRQLRHAGISCSIEHANENFSTVFASSKSLYLYLDYCPTDRWLRHVGISCSIERANEIFSSVFAIYLFRLLPNRSRAAPCWKQ